MYRVVCSKLQLGQECRERRFVVAILATMVLLCFFGVPVYVVAKVVIHVLGGLFAEK